MSRSRNPWIRIGMDAWSLGLGTSSVIVLRTMKMAAGGPAADAEGQRMISEKVRAGVELGTLAMTGGLGLTAQGAAAKTLVHYRRKVRANHRRLLKG